MRRPWRVSDARPKLLIDVLIIIVLAVAVILAVIIIFRRRNENNKNLDWVELNTVVAEALPDAFFLTDFILANELPRLKPSERSGLHAFRTSMSHSMVRVNVSGSLVR